MIRKTPRPSRSPQVRGRPLSLQSIRRAGTWHRRKLAVVAAVAAVLTGINAALPPDPPTVQAVRSAVRLDGGVVLTSDDVSVTRVPADAVPDDALTTLNAAVGRTVAAPVSKGQLLTELSVAAPGRSARPGRVVAPLRLGDADLVALLSVGDAVDVVAADVEAAQAAVVAREIRIVGLPPPPDAAGLGAPSSSSGGALVLVEVDSRTATALAQAAVTATLSVVLR
jgi:Flp pilus assembly protein CpaB